MSGTFSALNAATTALWAQRRALDVAGQNIANVNTEGYSRQRADMQAIGGSAVPAFYSTSDGIGGGVSVEQVTRIRDAFLEGRGHTEHANYARLSTEAGALEQVETAFREPGDQGIQSLLADVWDGWEAVTNGPDTDATRAQVLQQMEALVGGLHFASASLKAQWNQTRENLTVLVDDVNAAAASIADLNQAIQRGNQTSLPVNSLVDQRDLLVMKLADQAGASVRHGKDGMVDVIVGGVTLVGGTSATKLAVAGSLDLAGTGTSPVRVVTAVGGHTVRPDGTAAGQLAAMNGIFPSYQSDLDALAKDFADAVNGVHTTGAYDKLGNPGIDVFESADGSPINASNIRVAFDDPALIAASGLPGAANTDSSKADEIAQLRSKAGGPDATYRRLVVQLGVEAAVANRGVQIQQVITTQIDASRESVAGVNLDEEMTNMLSYQHAYAAAGRLVSTIDEMLDVLINRTGRVGL
ncbi:flagellar hook-associated protein 1 FlgK [Blastococcus aurantiacus]|uniref:Flagellar hook-associated protein 1 n=1 Tax=Blastococcus aurantiacus TaxID=1550231 RepID=A0A1G7JKF9_9ACTN|nr:flagellar hook-associated protein FlgK [Blastococcus aurantiacus]SDF25438.1 flagellar hook-associated protein 1 FlgK [Blastococcus aurantiacus]